MACISCSFLFRHAELYFQICTSPGVFAEVEAFVTGDGKGMLHSNWLEGEKCWLCDGPNHAFHEIFDATQRKFKGQSRSLHGNNTAWGSQLEPSATINPGPRYGAYLRAVFGVLSVIILQHI